MPRALAVARVTVAPADEAAYLAAAARLAVELGKRGQHLWVFRQPEANALYLEFREAANANMHTAVQPTLREAELTATLRSLGTPESGANDVWLEVPLAEALPPADGSA